jgi:hypothetical protein
MGILRVKRIRHGRLIALAVLAGAVLLATALGAAGARATGDITTAPPPRKPAPVTSSVDTHGYPRTYHLYGGGPIDELARYDMVVSSRSNDAAGLRLRNPSGIFLMQPTLQGRQVHVTAPGGVVGWPGANDSVRGGKPLGGIRAVNPESDFLHNVDGSLAGDGTILGWNLAGPAGVPEHVAKVFTYAAKLSGLYRCTVRVGKPGKQKRVNCWSGVHSDNWIFLPAALYGDNLDTNRDGVVDNEETLARSWSNGLTRLGNMVGSYLPGMVVGGNGAWWRPDLYAGSDPKGWLKSTNYTLIEHMQNFSAKSILGAASTWLNFKDTFGRPRYMAVLQDATDLAGKRVLWPRNDPNSFEAMTRPDVLRSMRWGLTLSLMTGVYYELIGDFYGNPIDSRWWFDEYDGGVGVHRRGYLGHPLGGYKTIKEDVYRRDFKNGIAINNSTSSTQTINLGGQFKKLKGTQNPTLNDGSTLTSVSVPPKDGIILLRRTA